MQKHKVNVSGKRLGEANWLEFSGVSDLADAMDNCNNYYTKKPDEKEAWAGGSWNEAKGRARNGQQSRVKRSDDLLAKIESLNDFVSSSFEVAASVTGGVPCVPAMLAGHPASMRMRRRTVSAMAPLAIIVDSTVSASITSATIERRGAAVLALVRILSALRPVSLYITAGLQSSGETSLISVPINTAPLDLARAAWALSSPDFLRKSCFGVHSDHAEFDHAIHWAFANHTWQTTEYPAWFAEQIGMPDFLPVTGVFSGTEFKSDGAAAKWVEDRARDLTGQQAAA